jgi:hypothetical protein
MEFRMKRPGLRSSCCYAIPLVVAFGMTSGALATPRQLYGKSVIVTWHEDRHQTTARDAQPRSVNASAEFAVYLSAAGRPFSRVTMNVTNMRGRVHSGKHDAVQGEGSARAFSFSGSTMNATMPRGDAAATHVVVTFDGGFQSCSARVLTGKAGGAHSSKVNSIAGGGQVDFYSVKASGESCRVQNGNVFGG